MSTSSLIYLAATTTTAAARRDRVRIGDACAGPARRERLGGAVVVLLILQRDASVDAAMFDPDSFIGGALAEFSIESLLRVHARVATEARALDAEKKTLIYDNLQ